MEFIMSTVFQFPTAIPRPARTGRATWRLLARAVTRIVRKGVDAWQVRQSIRNLQSLNDRMLADVGISRSEIEPAARRHMMHDWWPR